MLSRDPSLTQIATHAKKLRKSQTPAERLLWQKLQSRQLMGLHFRRQEPVGKYIADFVCMATRVIIELDGYSHEDKADVDAEKQQYLEQHGFVVLRFLNQDIYQNLDGVLETIARHCKLCLANTPSRSLPQGRS